MTITTLNAAKERYWKRWRQYGKVEWSLSAKNERSTILLNSKQEVRNLQTKSILEDVPRYTMQFTPCRCDDYDFAANPAFFYFSGNLFLN